MPRSQRSLLIGGLILFDALAVALAVTAAYRLSVTVTPDWAAYEGSLPLLLLVALPASIVLFALNRLYVADEILEGPVEYGRIGYACTLTAFILSAFGFWGKHLADATPSRKLVGLVWLLSLLAAGGTRFMARRIVRAMRRRGYFVSRALVVGLGTPGLFLARHFQETRIAGIKVVGFIDDFLSPGTPVTDGLKVLGPPSALPRILEQTGVTEVIVVPTAMAWESFQDLIRAAMTPNGHVIRLASGFGDILATNVRVHQFGGTPLLTIERIRITGLDGVLKRILDCVIALFLFAVALPVMVLFVLLLIATGVRPFRKTQVIGRRGVVFNTYPLNSGEPHNATQRLIRRLGLERLPQLVNVLCGQISFVGPRPILPGQRADFERWMPNLLTVKPGMIGPWTGGDPPALNDEMERILFYIRNYTVWMDLEVLVRCVMRLFARQSVPSDEAKAAADERLAVHR